MHLSTSYGALMGPSLGIRFQAEFVRSSKNSGLGDANLKSLSYAVYAMSTVAELVADLGGAVLSKIVSTPGDGQPITRVVVADPSETLEAGPGDLVLGIGVVPGSAADRLLAQLAAAGAAGLVTREAVAKQIAAQAERLDVNLFGIPAAAQWAQVILLISSVTSRERFGAPDERLWGAGAGDLFAIADVISELIGAHITIEDPQSRVIAFSKGQEQADEPRRLTILGRRVPERYLQIHRRRGVFQRLARESTPVFIEPTGEGDSPRIAVAVRAGNELLGAIWAMVPGPLSKEREARLTEASHFVALHLLRRNLSDDGSRLEAELLEAVLKGGRLAVEAAERLHLNGPAFAVIAATPSADHEVSEALLPRLRDLFSMHLSMDRRVPATVAGGIAYGVLTVPGTTDRIGDSVRATLDRLVERSHSVLHSTVLVGVGSVERSASAISVSRAHADEVIRVLRAEGRSGVAEIGEVASKVLLLKVSESLANDPGVFSHPIKVLQQHDLEDHTCYLSTLDAYLKAFGAVDTAAEQLHVHANTVRYRLRQIQRITRLKLTDPDERLALTIQLRFAAGTSGPKPSSS
jgi:PucR C-terminal helix-turn-helix domain/GGDEF-like domain